MTLAPPDRSGSSSAPDLSPRDEGDAVGGDAVGGEVDAVEQFVVRRAARQRHAVRRRRRRRLLILQTAATVLFVAVLAGLVTVGWNSAMRITGGSGDEVTDPAAPGYVAAARPTGVTLVAFSRPAGAVPAGEPEIGDPAPEGVPGDGALPEADPADGEPAAGPPPSEGELATMLLVIEDAGSGGSVLVPLSRRTTLWDFEDAPAEPADAVYASGGIDVLRLRLGADATFGMTSAISVPVELLSQLASQVGPITVSLPDDVLVPTPDGGTALRYGAGDLTLQPEEVVEFLELLGEDEPEANRSLRYSLVWEAILAAGASLPDGWRLDGEGEAIDEFEELLGELSAGITFDQFPMEPVPLFTEPPVTIYRIDDAAMPAWVPEHVPFPVSAYPGQRARVELLNGTGDAEAVRATAPAIVSAGGEVTLTGNAESFDVAASRVEFGSPEAGAAAEQIAAALGVTAVPGEDVPGNVDVVVVVGRDLRP